jgi:flagellar transcriptional activator FlhC
MRGKRVVADARDVARATELIELGMRLQMLESETPLSRERLTKLYKELKGKSPPKGMLPFSTDWFVTWMPNVHASLFAAIHHHLIKTSALDDIDALIKAYRLYLEQCRALGLGVELSITRAWRLLRFLDARMLKIAPCTCCRGEFVVREYDLTRNYVCGLCSPPSRAGRRRAADEPLAAAA